MKTRYELHEFLCEILGSRNVYFQPPESVKMKYPAIVYERTEIKNRFANDAVYKQNNAYLLTLIDKDPDSEVSKQLANIPLCRLQQHFVSDNLNHDIFKIYY